MSFYNFYKDRCRLKWRCPLYKSSYEQRLILYPNAHLCSNSEYGKTIYTHPHWDYRLFTKIPHSSPAVERKNEKENCF